MKRLKEFVLSGIIGGIVVLIPLPVLFLLLKWIFDSFAGIIQPITTALLSFVPFPELLVTVLVLIIFLVFCFFVGHFVQTRFGKYIHDNLENYLLNKIPLYSTVKEFFALVLRRDKTLSRTVAVFRPLLNSPIELIVFVTDTLPNGDLVIFVPTAPSPTNGYVLRVPKEQITVISVSKEEALRAIFSCGIGGEKIFRCTGR